MLYLALSFLLVVQDEETTKQVEKLIKTLASEKSAEAAAAATELGSLGPKAKAAIPALRDALKAKSHEVRALSAAALLLIDQAEASRAMPTLLDAFKQPNNGFLQLNLLGMLSNRLKPTHKETVEGYLKLAGEDNAIAWIIADEALGRIEKGNKDINPALEAGLKEKAVRARVMAARCLGRVEPSRVKEAVAVLRDSLKESDLDLRLLTAADLLELDPDQSKFVIETLTPHLKDKDAFKSCRVGVFLLELDAGQADAVLPLLRETLKASDTSRIAQMLQLLGRSLRKKPDRFKLVSPLLEQLLASNDPLVKAETLRQLANLGPIALPTEKLLREAAKDRQPAIALPAIEALIRVRPDKGASLVPQLIELAVRRDRAAQGTLELLDLLEKLKLLQAPGGDEDWGASMGEQIEQRKRRERGAWHREELLRLHTIIELGDLKSKGRKGVPALINVLKERDTAGEIVRGQAAIALGRIGRPAVAAIPVLLKITKDDTDAPDVRLAAREAMKMIDRDNEK